MEAQLWVRSSDSESDNEQATSSSCFKIDGETIVSWTLAYPSPFTGWPTFPGLGPPTKISGLDNHPVKRHLYNDHLSLAYPVLPVRGRFICNGTRLESGDMSSARSFFNAVLPSTTTIRTTRIQA